MEQRIEIISLEPFMSRQVKTVDDNGNTVEYYLPDNIESKLPSTPSPPAKTGAYPPGSGRRPRA